MTCPSACDHLDLNSGIRKPVKILPQKSSLSMWVIAKIMNISGFEIGKVYKFRDLQHVQS